MNLGHEAALAGLAVEEAAYAAQRQRAALLGLRARTPRSSTWQERERHAASALQILAPEQRQLTLELRVYERAGSPGRLRVLSALALAKAPSGDDTILQWHLSVSRPPRSADGRGRRPDDAELRRVRLAFDLVDAEEDNHHPGIARHLWLPVDPARRVGCECKADEVVVVEPDGYAWTNPVDADPSVCRACEIARLLPSSLVDRCPVHG